MKQHRCPVIENGGIFFSTQVLGLAHLSKLQQALLAYIENCEGPCNASTEHLASIMRCSKQRINNALDTLAACGFFLLEDGALRNGLQINYKTQAWVI